MTSRPLSVSINLGFVLLDALLWLALGTIVAVDVHPALPDLPVYKTILAVLSFAIAGILLGLFFLLGKRSRVFHPIALSVFSVLSIMTIFDGFGLVDLIVLILHIVPIVLLIKDRAWYIKTAIPPLGEVERS